MEINWDTNLSEFETKIDNLIIGLNSISKNYSNYLADINGKLSTLDYGSWDDSVKSKLEQATNEFKKSIVEVENDISSGGLYSIIEAANEIIESIGGLKTCKEVYYDRAKRLDNWEEKVKTGSEQAGWKDEIMRDKEAGYLSGLNWINKINRLLTVISSTEFNKPVSSDDNIDEYSDNDNSSDDDIETDTDDFSEQPASNDMSIQVLSFDSPADMQEYYANSDQSPRYIMDNNEGKIYQVTREGENPFTFTLTNINDSSELYSGIMPSVLIVSNDYTPITINNNN